LKLYRGYYYIFNFVYFVTYNSRQEAEEIGCLGRSTLDSRISVPVGNSEDRDGWSNK
jgi:hypothetical protein